MADTYRLGDQLFRIINQEAVELLRSWLASAEAGELREVVLLGMEGDDNVWAATGTLSRTQHGRLYVLATPAGMVDVCLGEESRIEEST